MSACRPGRNKVLILGKHLLQKKCLPIFAGIVLVIIIIQLDQNEDVTNRENSVEVWTDRETYITKFGGNFSILKGHKPRILFWTNFFGNRHGWKLFYGEPSQVCPAKCFFSWNRTDVTKSDVIVMNLRDMSDFDNRLPETRTQSQVWMLHNTEPPQLSFLDLQYYNNVFNWTSFVRLDSDVPSYYGKLVRRQQATNSEYVHVNESDVSMKSIPRKSKSVVWMASNCITASEREWYVRELKKYIDVEIYGKCGNLTCSSKAPSACKSALQQSHFYLAFENAKCRDYVTEKFWRALTLGLIPVVLGGRGAHQNIAPQGSYIDSQEFSSPKDLAAFLKEVISNKTLYNSFFLWKKKWKVGGDYFCDLCESVHNWNGSPQVYHDLIGWYRQDTCSPWNIWKSVHHKLKFVPYYILYYLGLW